MNPHSLFLSIGCPIIGIVKESDRNWFIIHGDDFHVCDRLIRIFRKYGFCIYNYTVGYSSWSIEVAYFEETPANTYRHGTYNITSTPAFQLYPEYEVSEMWVQDGSTLL